MPQPNQQPDWMATVRVGDVLTNGRTYRVVRDVTRWHSRMTRDKGGEGPLRYVTFTTKRCSWTRRCYALLTASDLKSRGFRPAGVRVKLNKAIDVAIAECVSDRSRSLKCCDVRGVA